MNDCYASRRSHILPLPILPPPFIALRPMQELGGLLFVGFEMIGDLSGQPLPQKRKQGQRGKDSNPQKQRICGMYGLSTCRAGAGANDSFVPISMMRYLVN
jgi:hypothetical protein